MASFGPGRIPVIAKTDWSIWLLMSSSSTAVVLEGEPDVVAATAATLQAQFAKGGIPD